MSARDELRREMTHNHLYMTDERADELIDDLLHETAGRLRERGNSAMEAADAQGGRTTPSDPKYDKAATWYAAADLIDPKA